MKIVKVAAAPTLGIYWITPGQGMVTFAEPAHSVPTDTAGFRNAPFDHDALWSKVVASEPALRDKEYFEVPRGRVLYVEATRKFRVLSSSADCANRSRMAAVARAFHLPMAQVECQPDSHYESHVDFDDD